MIEGAPLIPSTMPEEIVTDFGKQVPMKRPGQPAELATAYVMLADLLSSYTSRTTVAVGVDLHLKVNEAAMVRGDDFPSSTLLVRRREGKNNGIRFILSGSTHRCSRAH